MSGYLDIHKAIIAPPPSWAGSDGISVLLPSTQHPPQLKHETTGHNIRDSSEDLSVQIRPRGIDVT